MKGAKVRKSGERKPYIKFRDYDPGRFIFTQYSILQDKILLVLLHRGTNSRFQPFGRRRIHLAAKKILQIEFQSDIICTRRLLELVQYIHTAAFLQADMRFRTKQGQRPNAIVLNFSAIKTKNIHTIITMVSVHDQIILLSHGNK